MVFNNSVNANETGFQSLTSAGAWHGRTLIAGTGITISNPDGTAGNPTISSTGGGFTPNVNVQLVDDFIGISSGGGSASITQLPWTYVNAGFNTNIAGTSDHPGISNQTGNKVAVFGMYIDSTTGGGPLILGGGAMTIDFVINIKTLSTATNRYVMRFGLGDNIAAGDQTNGVYFEYSDNINSGQWAIKTAKAGTRTTTNSATTVTTAWHHGTIAINAAGTSVTFTMDGVSLGTIATNMPIVTLKIINMYDVTAGTIASDSLEIDLFYLTQTLTNTR